VATERFAGVFSRRGVLYLYHDARCFYHVSCGLTAHEKEPGLPSHTRAGKKLHGIHARLPYLPRLWGHHNRTSNSVRVRGPDIRCHHLQPYGDIRDIGGIMRIGIGGTNVYLGCKHIRMRPRGGRSGQKFGLVGPIRDQGRSQLPAYLYRVSALWIRLLIHECSQRP
jgi:hypothetical protein